MFWVSFQHKRTSSYSPTASRTYRIQQIHRQIRRESVNSSIGAASVRRLINNQIRPIKHQHTLHKKIVCKNILTLCSAHALISATFLPLLALQSSVSVWTQHGALLLSLLYISSAISALIAPYFIHKLDTSRIFQIGYTLTAIFFATHFLPILESIIISYFGFGLIMGIITLSRVTFVINLSTKTGGDEENRKMCLIRRLARGLQGAQDFGLILGSLITGILIRYYHLEEYDDDVFEFDDSGSRICGSLSCPITNLSNNTEETSIIPKRTSDLLVAVYVGFAITALIIVCIGLDRIQLFVHQDPLERGVGRAVCGAIRDGFKDTKLQLSAMLALFIGLEQGFMYGDFSKVRLNSNRSDTNSLDR